MALYSHHCKEEYRTVVKKTEVIAIHAIQVYMWSGDTAPLLLNPDLKRR